MRKRGLQCAGISSQKTEKKPGLDRFDERERTQN